MHLFAGEPFSLARLSATFVVIRISEGADMPFTPNVIPREVVTVAPEPAALSPRQATPAVPELYVS